MTLARYRVVYQSDISIHQIYGVFWPNVRAFAVTSNKCDLSVVLHGLYVSTAHVSDHGSRWHCIYSYCFRVLCSLHSHGHARNSRTLADIWPIQMHRRNVGMLPYTICRCIIYRQFRRINDRSKWCTPIWCEAQTWFRSKPTLRRSTYKPPLLILTATLNNGCICRHFDHFTTDETLAVLSIQYVYIWDSH